MTEGSEQPESAGIPEQPAAAAPQRSGGGASGLWESPAGKTAADVITDPVSALRVITIAAALLGLGNLVADMRSLDGYPDWTVWGSFMEDLFYTVVFVGVLHGLRTIIENQLKK